MTRSALFSILILVYFQAAFSQNPPPTNARYDAEHLPWQVDLMWTPPEGWVPSAVDRWYEWDDGINTTGIGTSFYEAEAAARWDALMLSMYDEVFLTKIKYYLIDTQMPYALRVYQGTPGSFDTLMHYPLEGNINYNEFDTLEIDPLPLDPAKDLWIGYHVTSMAGGYPFPCGSWGKVNEGYGNMIKVDNFSWTPLTSINPEHKYNWNIGGYLETPGDTIIYPLFNIYRALDEGEFEKINDEPFLDTIFFDYTYGLNADHIYYYITCVYEDGESEPSNIVDVSFVGTGEQPLSQFQAFPNPARDVLNVVLGIEKSASYQLINTLGLVAGSGLLTGQTSQIDMTSLRPGVYFLVLLDEQARKVGGVVKVMKY